MGTYTHVVEYSDGRNVTSINEYADLDEFARPMRLFDGVRHLLVDKPRDGYFSLAVCSRGAILPPSC